MRIIANDVTPEMGSEGSNPSLSVPARMSHAGFFVALWLAGQCCLLILLRGLACVCCTAQAWVAVRL